MPKLDVIAIDPDPRRVALVRGSLERHGVYGSGVSAYAGDPAKFPLPPYLASFLFAMDVSFGQSDRDVAYVSAVFRALRPYGGTAHFFIEHDKLAQLVEEAKLPGAKVKRSRRGSLLVRDGPLPGAADWTHQYADAANSVVSRDQRVKAPLGLLWFGGPPNDEVLPRHGHGPSPQVAGGRLFIEGRNMLRALDIYTGRLLWQKDLPDLGLFYDNTSHQSGAGEIGSNYVSLDESVYAVYGDAILELDAATGNVKREFKAEAEPGGARAVGGVPLPHPPPPGTVRSMVRWSGPRWGFLAAYQDLLIATSTPVSVDGPGSTKKPDPARPTFGRCPAAKPADGSVAAEPEPPTFEEVIAPVRYASASRRLVVFDRRDQPTNGHQPKVGRPVPVGARQALWHRDAKYGFRHNNIAVAAEKLFLIDGLSRAKQEAIKRRGVDLADYQPRLLALNVRSGEEVWSTSEDVFGTFLNYSEEHDVLLQAGSAFRDRAADEAETGMVAYRGQDGTVLWKNLGLKHAGPCMLHHDTILTQGPAYSLLTGEPKIRQHPLSGEPLPWSFTRNYGCNTAVASEHLITFRSAAAGYYDLAGDGGTGNLGGFKSGCTSNLIVAGGLLNAPEYTRTCRCRYQNQTSLALVHDPDVEMWTFNALAWDGKPVRRVGINFGAPGDRRADDGTLWLDYPSVGGPSPDIPVELEIEDARYFRRHSSLIQAVAGGGGLPWVAASGLVGAGRLTVTLTKEESPPPRKYTVRLHFAEVEDVEPGQRVFAVRLQGEEVLAKFDIARQAGRGTAVVKEFAGIRATDKLEVVLAPGHRPKVGPAGESAPPLLCGLEIVAEGW